MATQWWQVGLAMYVLLFTTGAIGFGVWRRRRLNYRPPLQFKLLRGPGETLRRETQHFDENFELYALGAALLPFLPAYVALAALAAIAPKTPLAAAIGLCLLAWLLGAVASGRWLWLKFVTYRNCHLGYLGERAVSEYLQTLSAQGYRVFHDVPAIGTKAFNLDHVTVGPTGVAVIETKTRRKGRALKGREAHKVFYDGMKLDWPWGQNRDGLDQVVNGADWLGNWLYDRTGMRLPIKPVLVIPGWWVEQKARGPVAVIDLKHVADAVRGHGEVALTSDQADLIARQLDERCRDVED